MKYLLKTFVFLFCVSISLAQNTAGKTDDSARIQLSTFVSEQIDGLPSAAKNLLKNKLNKIVTMNGLGGTTNSRFIITPNISVLFQEVLPGPPRKVALTLEVNFYIGDGIEGILFASETMTVKGVGNSDTKAYISALKQIKAKNPIFKDFIANGKTKIMEYYNDKCDFIKKESMGKAERKEYDEALADLLAVPEVCKECYMACQDLTLEVFKMKLENECAENIQKATVAKTNNQWDEAASHLVSILPEVSCFDAAQKLLSEIEDHRCAESMGKAKGAWANRDSQLASSYLSEVSADSKCASEAKQLFTSISAKLDAEDKREWDFAYEKYDRAQSYEENQGFELKKSAINAARQIGVAAGKNQPKTVYNIRGWY
ncbi:MAG: hypothetical protein ACI93P_001097 [bacterium]|jgi:hypothetical protein